MHPADYRLLNREDWLNWLGNCPYATFYHTPYWYEAWQRIKGYRIEARLLTVDGTEVFYAHATKGKFLDLLDLSLSSPAGTYGGFLSRKSITQPVFDTLAKRFRKTTLGIFVHCPLQPLDFKPLGVTDFTQIIRLNKSFEKLINNWSKGHLSAAKKGIREGVTVRIADGIKDWEDYFSIYQQSLENWGKQVSSRYSRSFFDYLASLDQDVCKLWLATFEGKVIAGSLVFYYNQHVSYWHGVGLKEYLPVKAAHVLQYYILEHAVQNQYTWYDMNPSGGHEGVVHFKNGFGGEKMPVITETYTGSRNKLLRQLLIRAGYAQ